MPRDVLKLLKGVCRVRRTVSVFLCPEPQRIPGAQEPDVMREIIMSDDPTGTIISPNWYPEPEGDPEIFKRTTLAAALHAFGWKPRTDTERELELARWVMLIQTWALDEATK